jgi:hypothetical protein
MSDEHRSTDTTSTSTTATATISTADYAEFAAYRAAQIRNAALIEGQNMSSAQHIAEEHEADATALKKLSDRGLTLKDAFGPLSTQRGRDTLANIHRSSFSSKSGSYTRLRRQAIEAGIVK